MVVTKQKLSDYAPILFPPKQERGVFYLVGRLDKMDKDKQIKELEKQNAAYLSAVQATMGERDAMLKYADEQIAERQRALNKVWSAMTVLDDVRTATVWQRLRFLFSGDVGDLR